MNSSSESGTSLFRLVYWLYIIRLCCHCLLSLFLPFSFINWSILSVQCPHIKWKSSRQKSTHKHGKTDVVLRILSAADFQCTNEQQRHHSRTNQNHESTDTKHSVIYSICSFLSNYSLYSYFYMAMTCCVHRRNINSKDDKDYMHIHKTCWSRCCHHRSQ